MRNKDHKSSKETERNVVARNTKIIGDINSEGDFRIDGTLEGALITNGRIIIGAEGFVKGNVTASNADIEGKFSGHLQVENTLSLKASAFISGEVAIGKLSIEPGAIFNATCTMKGTVKELNHQNDQKKFSEKTAQ